MDLMGNLGIPACNSSDPGIAAIKIQLISCVGQLPMIHGWLPYTRKLLSAPQCIPFISLVSTVITA